MKKQKFLLLAFMLTTVIGFMSCKSDEIEEANVQLTLNQTNIESLTFAEPIQITGSATSDQAITSLTFTGVKLVNGDYVPQGDEQEYDGTGTTTVKFQYGVFCR